MMVSALTTKQILVIDDDAGIRQIVRLTLESNVGWHVTTAASGPEGVKRAQRQPFDAILLDMMMPNQDGVETLQQLQQEASADLTPVIFFTAKTCKAEPALLQQPAIAGIITKPFKAGKLVNEVRSILGW